MILVLSLTTLLARNQIVACFASDVNVLKMSATLLMVIALVTVFDGSQTYLQGPIRAMGLQKNAAYFAIASHWVIAIPMAGILSFWLDIGAIGLPIGTCLGVFV